MAVTFDYSMVIMWIYFIAYVLMFLVVSIICAIDVHKEKFPNANIIQLIKAWVVSLWKKKKIYGELLPHFFDQATDFGVVYEFGKLWEENKNKPPEERIGINTQYLFYLSFIIIIVHRVVSAAAVYNLTHKPMYAVYQFLDVLMIRCVYTNYKLDTDQPSNAQRYLQTMEAIFESAPQILISAAFIIKTSETYISATVVASLFTSLYSLSARVSADDRVMLQDDWKEPKIRNSKGKWVAPFINIKYIVRVVFWRFLEISSRITLLVLTWINLGGRVIFFILFIEFCYLAVLAWALGTIDIMGNLIYLMAANSKRKGYKWAIPMAKIFWVWRVLSGWALLITVSIYAGTDSKYGMDVLDNEAGETRYQQTFEHPAGLALFVYSWVATPLWQWVGAIVIFDYKNLASVGRDVDTLVEDGKWDEVLELVSFGADFNPVKLLQKIEREKSIKPDKEDKAEMSRDVSLVEMRAVAVAAPAAPTVPVKQEEEQKEGEGAQAPKEEELNCPGKHGLEEFKAQSDGMRCDICGDKKRKEDLMYGCRECQYDVCAGCKEGAVRLVKCNNGHILKHKPTTNKCTRCKGTNKSTNKTTWSCDHCAEKYYLCDRCYEKRRDLRTEPAIVQLEEMCKEQIAEDKASENDKLVKLRQLCEYMCSCPTFMCFAGMVLLAGGIWYGMTQGFEAEGFFFGMCPIFAAAILIFCAVSCFFDMFSKWSECIKEKKIQRKKSIAMGRINCPGKHGLTLYNTEGDGLGCDLCKKKVSRGTKLYGCRDCNYDVCTVCKPEPVIVVPKPKKTVEIDDIITCPENHMLIWRRRGAYACGKCEVNYDKTRSWYCKKCDYYMCLKCFEAAQKNQVNANVLAWMKNRNKSNERRIRNYGGVAWLVLIALAFFLGSDIAALVVSGSYQCNIKGGSEYVSFDVGTFLQVGAIIHLSILGWNMCLGGCYAFGDFGYSMEENFSICGAGCTCCAFMFNVCWIVIGFLLHSEMTPDNVVDDAQCIRMVHSWTIIKLIEFGGLPLLAGCGGLVAYAFDDPSDFFEKAGILCGGGLAFLTGLGFFLGSDIALLVIADPKYGCDNAINADGFSILEPSQWMYGGGIAHLSMLLLAGCAAVSEKVPAMVGLACCSFLYFGAWIVLGFMMYPNITGNKMCGDAIMQWLVLKLIEIVAGLCGLGLAVFG